MINAFEYLGIIDKLDWIDYTNQFDKSEFDVYITRALVKVEEEEQTLSRDFEAKLVTSKTLDQIWTRFYKVVEHSDSLDSDEKERLLKRWEGELGDFSSAFIGQSLEEWLKRDDQVILF
jgi:hypothetical protein